MNSPSAVRQDWTKEQLKLAFYLYCQIPFGRISHRNPEIIALADLMKRTPSSVSMKLANFASLDPSITDSGRKGLTGASQKDREVWDEFHADWESLAAECEALRAGLAGDGNSPKVAEAPDFGADDFTGETREATVSLRLKQGFFRRSVLSNYRERCCISGLAEPRLLVASHIVPWGMDAKNRLNPRNGLCLSAIHDKAFDKGLITLSDDFQVLLAEELRRRHEEFVVRVFHSVENKRIEVPERFVPSREFLELHRQKVFLGG